MNPDMSPDEHWERENREEIENLEDEYYKTQDEMDDPEYDGN